jgi:uncharacterized protein YjlB
MNVEHVIFQSSAWVPNNPDLPVLLYRAALQELDWSDFETAFAANGWTGIWRDGVFDFQHYHSGAHEVLGVASGDAELLIGGVGGHVFHVVKGDCLILPAGTGHQNLGASPDFEIVGAYPKDQYADIQTAAPTQAMQTTISTLPIPDTDPVFGSNGGVLEYWR